MPILQCPKLGDNILEQTHVAIAGTTGSGKSVLLQQILYALFCRDPKKNGAVLIDPKRVELSRFGRFPHVWSIDTEPGGMRAALQYTVNAMEHRYKVMRANGLTDWPGPAVYVVIDELADLVTNDAQALDALVKLGRLGRAAKIHLICATQSPDRKTLSAQLVQNFTARVALRCRDRIESRQILGAPGAETLPKYGRCLYYSPDTLQPVPVNVLRIDQAAWDALGDCYNGIRVNI